jgi:hypothetical protein
MFLVGFESDDRMDTTMRARVGRYIFEEMNLGCMAVGFLCFFDDRN